MSWLAVSLVIELSSIVFLYLSYHIIRKFWRGEWSCFSLKPKKKQKKQQPRPQSTPENPSPTAASGKKHSPSPHASSTQTSLEEGLRESSHRNHHLPIRAIHSARVQTEETPTVLDTSIVELPVV
jgi:hypothetical protein